MNNTEKLYAERDIENLDTYSDHVFHMTSENLRSNSDIAAELAYRDQQIAELTKQRDELEDSLLSLLAIVHRDGGHYVADHGIGRAVNDAILKVAANNSVIDEALSTQGDSDE